MDMQKPGWYGRVEISGSSRDITFEGSPRDIILRLTQELIQLNPRTMASGAKTINLTLSTQPIDDAGIQTLQLTSEVTKMILGESGPGDRIMALPDESYLEMVKRLNQQDGMSATESIFWARDAFGYGPDPDFDRRTNDPKVFRFNKLNASDRAVEEADPREYESLKTYVRDTYADWFQTIVCRR